MDQISRGFGLSDEPGRFGLSCTGEGLTLAGVPLLRRTGDGFEPRPAEEVRWLLGQAYQTDVDAMALMGGLGATARALNGGETVRSMIVAILLELPDLDWDGAVRIARAEDALAKFGHDREQPRDQRGRWVTEDSGGEAGASVDGYSHHYVFYQMQVCSHSSANCSIDYAWNGLLRNAYPGQDPTAGPIPAPGGDYSVFGEPNGRIHSSVDAENMVITNDALPGHIFYPGKVKRSVVDTPAGIFIRTEGLGSNSSMSNWVENHVAGFLGFQGPDSNIRAYITNPGFYDRTRLQ